MCERGCKDCKLVRFVKPQEGGRSFCVTPNKADEVCTDINKANNFIHTTDTHEETTDNCDHPKIFELKIV